MNLFEKIFNYQIAARMNEAGALAITSQERRWLKLMLEHPAAFEAFDAGTLQKLQHILEPEQPLQLGHAIIQKARPAERSVYHPCLRQLRRAILQGDRLMLSFRTKRGGLQQRQPCFPYKLEYSMVKREWQLIWYQTRRHMLMSTKLTHIISMEQFPLDAGKAAELRSKLAAMLSSRKQQALIELNPAYNEELSRILHAFSCFEKQVIYDEKTGVYRIQVVCLSAEIDFLLYKLRFLGKRVHVLEPAYLQLRMADTAAKALARYAGGADSPSLQ